MTVTVSGAPAPSHPVPSRPVPTAARLRLPDLARLAVVGLRTRKLRAASQRRPGIITRKKAPSARSTRRGGSTSMVRAPSAAPGMPPSA